MWILIIIFIAIASAIIYSQIRNARIYRELLQSVTSPHRGTKSEHDLVVALLKSGILADDIFHDLYVRKYNGHSQIDLVVMTKVGLIVFEVKDYSGWIFGNGNHTNWTKVLAYGRQKYKFYNPIKQNLGHIAALRKHLSENIPIYSIILFAGNCELRDISFVPNGTFIAKPYRILSVMRDIIDNNQPVDFLTENQIRTILKESVKNGDNIDAESTHIENVRNMLGHDRIYG
jgi:hypothetical protein